jgi:hypothetical protein
MSLQTGLVSKQGDPTSCYMMCMLTLSYPYSKTSPGKPSTTYKSRKVSTGTLRLLRRRYQSWVVGKKDGVEGVIDLQKQKVLRTLAITLVEVAAGGKVSLL